MPFHPALVIAFLTSLMAVGHVSNNMYTPSMPSMSEYFATDAATVQLTMSVYLLAFAVAQLAYGPLSDRFGRRPVLIAGLILYAVASAAAAFSGSITVLIVMRAFQAFGACAGPVIARAMVRDLFGREQAAKVMAYIGLAMGAAPAFAPVLGGFLQTWFGWQASFVFITGFAVAVLVLTWTRLEETNTERSETQGWWLIVEMVRNYWRLLKSREYLGFVVTGSFVFAGVFAFMAGAPFVVIEILGYSPVNFGLVSIAPIGGYVVGSFFTSRVAERLGVDRLVPLGISILFAGALVLLGVALMGSLSIYSIYVPMTFMSFGMAVVFPSTLAGSISVHPEIAGAGSALYGFLQMAAAAAGIYISGIFEDGTEMPMIWTVSLAIFAAAAAAIVAAWGRKRATAAA
ncbi:MAG: multidrug effflux MFS transporter [Proteobacteria bacterium]|nr:multidrug effflux MFS transporter [Pseudomonadota bacterium]